MITLSVHVRNVVLHTFVLVPRHGTMILINSHVKVIFYMFQLCSNTFVLVKHIYNKTIQKKKSVELAFLLRIDEYFIYI